MKPLAALTLLLAAAPAMALDYTEWKAGLKTDEGRATIRAWLDGFGSGVGMYDVRQSMDKKQRRFCPPQGVRLSPELLAGLVDKTVEQQPALGKPGVPVQSIIWVGLERQFPCKPAITG